MELIKVAIADDHQIFRKGVILSMRPYTDIKFVMEAENGEDLLSKIPETAPDVILCNLKMNFLQILKNMLLSVRADGFSLVNS